MELKNRITLITGSSSGIGEATAKLFAKEGARVIVNCKSTIAKGRKVVSEIKSAGGQAFFMQADISKENDADRLFSEVQKQFNGIDILINNAGAARPKPFLRTTYQDWLSDFDDNFFGTILCSQRAAKIMLRKRKGKIINTSSIRGISHTGREEIMPYSAAKAAINNFTKTLAKELAPNIQVNAVAPGFTSTPFYDRLPKGTKKKFIKGTLIKRFITVDEIAKSFLYLATSDSITGEILVVDGGFNLKNG